MTRLHLDLLLYHFAMTEKTYLNPSPIHGAPEAGSGAVGRLRSPQGRPSNAHPRRFNWRGLSYHLGRRTRPVLTLVQDATYPHLYRIRYPDGWTSSPANLSRAKDAAFGHARHLLGDSDD